MSDFNMGTVSSQI